MYSAIVSPISTLVCLGTQSYSNKFQFFSYNNVTFQIHKHLLFPLLYHRSEKEISKDCDEENDTKTVHNFYFILFCLASIVYF